MDKKASLTIKEIGTVLKLNPIPLTRKAKRYNWPFFELKIGRGNPTKFYPFLELPQADLQVNIIRGCSNELFERLLPAITAAGTDKLHSSVSAAIYERQQASKSETDPGLVPVPKKLLDKKEEKIALARADLLKTYIQYANHSGFCGKTAAKQRFVELYNRGELCSSVYSLLGPTSYKTIERWHVKYSRSRNDYYALARDYQKSKKKTITSEEERCLLNRALSGDGLITQIIRDAKQDMDSQGVPVSVSDMTYRRFLENYKEKNHDIWTMSRLGEKAYRDQCGWYVDRDTDQLEVGDVIVADGHTLNFQIIDPATGLPRRMTLIVWFDMASSFPVGWVIMPTENTDAINLALRMAIIVLGKIPKIAYMDNGRAFRSKFFKGVDDFKPSYTGIFEKLEIQWIYARKHNARAKTVERFFGYLADFERKAPSYVGTSISKKPAHMRRGETLHKKLHKQTTGGRIPRLEDVYVALAKWIEGYINTPQPRGRLGESTPLEVFKAGQGPGVDIHRLTLLMLRSKPLKAARCEVALTINKEKITYQSEQLHGLDCKVEVLYDPMYPDSILVYNLAGDLICEAFAKERVHPAAKFLGDESDLEQYRQQESIRQRLEATTKQIIVEKYEQTIVPMLQSDTQRLGFGKGVVSIEESRKKTKKKKEAAALGAKYSSTSSLESVVEIPQSLNPGAETNTEPVFEYDYQRYEYLQEQVAMRSLTLFENTFVKQFETTDEYKMIYQSKATG